MKANTRRLSLLLSLWDMRNGGLAVRVAMLGSLVPALFFATTTSAQEIQAYCEWKEKNMAVEDPYPEFCWKVDNQTHCRVLVSASEAELADHRGGMWDSDKVEFAAHLQEYLAEQELVEPQGAIWLRPIESHDSLRSQLDDDMG